MEERPAKHAERVGVVATDPLRVLGLKSIFRDAMQLEIVHLSIPGALDDGNLCLVLIDAECTDHLFELIAHLPPGASLAQAHRARQRDLAGLHRARHRRRRQRLSPPHRHARPTSAWPSTWCATAPSGRPRKVLSRLLDSQRNAARSPADAARTSPPANARCSICCAPASPTARSPRPRHRRRHRQGAHRPPAAQGRRQ